MTAAPLPFATVHMCLGTVSEADTDPRRQFNLRVPVTETMTVRQLAKEAMKRLVAIARHREIVAQKDGEHVLRVAQSAARRLSVTEVVVLPVEALMTHAKNGTVPSTANTLSRTAVALHTPVELFSSDCVVSVVSLAREVVRLALCAAEDDPVSHDEASQSCVETALAAPSSTSTVDLDSLPPRQPTRRSPSASARRSVGQRRKRERDTQEARAATPRAAARAHKSDSNDGGQSSSSSATSCLTDSSSDGEGEAHRQAQAAKSIALLRERETARRLRWGQEAHKHFANNYVSSPEKLMYRRYTQRRRREEPSTHTPSRVNAPVSPDDDSPPPLTAPANTTCGVSRDDVARTKRRSSRPAERGGTASTDTTHPLHQPPAIPAELLPDASTAAAVVDTPLAARQLCFEDEDDGPMEVTAATHSTAAGHRLDSPHPLDPAATANETSTSHASRRVLAEAPRSSADTASALRTPTHFLRGSFSQPLPATFKTALPPVSHPPGTATPTKLSTPSLSGDSPAPRTPPTVPRPAEPVATSTATELSAPRSLGWGGEASKYFDASTYCDDPTKAVIDETQRHQPVRARRNKEPSFVLRYIL